MPHAAFMWFVNSVRIFAKYESNRICLPAMLRKSNWLQNDLFHTWELLSNFFAQSSSSLALSPFLFLPRSVAFHSNWMTELWKLKIIANFIFCGGANAKKHRPRRDEWEFTQVIFLERQAFAFRSFYLALLSIQLHLICFFSAPFLCVSYVERLFLNISRSNNNVNRSANVQYW